jgi:hypothetical protein
MASVVCFIATWKLIVDQAGRFFATFPKRNLKDFSKKEPQGNGRGLFRRVWSRISLLWTQCVFTPGTRLIKQESVTTSGVLQRLHIETVSWRRWGHNVCVEGDTEYKEDGSHEFASVLDWKEVNDLKRLVVDRMRLIRQWTFVFNLSKTWNYYISHSKWETGCFRMEICASWHRLVMIWFDKTLTWEQSREEWSTEEESHRCPGHFWICKFGTVPGNMTCVEKKFELQVRVINS